ncbi:hypothetical protein BH18THE2_BH18THE2_42110 [soil metagenome]
MSLTSLHDYYCITGDELTKSHGLILLLLFKALKFILIESNIAAAAIANKPMTIDFSEIFLSKSFHFI